MKSVAIIGVGRVGGALALALHEKGYRTKNLFTRNNINAEKILENIGREVEIDKLENIDEVTSEVIFISTQDAEIENVVGQLTNKTFQAKTYIYHTSGSLSSEILIPLKEQNCFVGSIHPLVSVSDSVRGVKRFKNAYFCVEGDAEACELAYKIVEDLGGKAFAIETKYKTLYHASAVTACGHIVAVIDVALEMLQKCGLTADAAKKILMPLMKSTIENVGEQKISEALTGTFARADSETFERHIEVLNKNVSAEILEIYLLLGERSLKLAKEQGIDGKKISEMLEKISLAKKNLKC